jgi:hypothetical protein
MYTSINNRAQNPPGPPPSWVPIHGEIPGSIYDNYFGYDMETDTWYFDPFDQFVLGAVQEDPAVAPGNSYGGQFYLGTGVQWNSTDGYADEFLGAGGNLVPYMHLVVNVGQIPCGETGTITIQGLPTTVEGGRVGSVDWLGTLTPSTPSAKWVPTGTIDFFCVPEPASFALLAITGIPMLMRRRR